MNLFLLTLMLLNKTSITISSPAFSNNGNIPAQYTCEGKNINPAIQIGTVPKETKSLTLIVDDPDADKGVITHWVAWNIDPATSKIEENSKPGIQGKNEKGELGYMGPCPATGMHHYYFKVYALDKKLDLKAGASKAEVLNAINGHILAEGELVGLYQKKQ
ncbi:MAG: Phospholipid-binding protein [Bacteroidetes bacterium]|nr:Phospholipid-binding protein [Bacteroidota bacterium]